MDVNSQNLQLSTCMTKSSSEYQSPLNDSHTNGKRKRMLDDTDIDSNSTDVAPVYPNLKYMKQIKHFVREIAIHDRTTIEVQSDGSFIIRPYSSQLANEIITLILSHLNTGQHRKTIYQCTLVTKQFNTIATPLLWKTPSFTHSHSFPYGLKERLFMGYISDTSEQRLSILGQHIRKLELVVYPLTDTFLQRLAPHVPNLTHISLSRDNNITDTGFQHLISHCQQLISLKLQNTRLTRASFSAISKYCPKLQHLHCGITKNQSAGDCLESLVQCRLKTLVLLPANLWPISQLTERALTSIQQFDRLTSLTLNSVFHASAIHTFVRLATHLSPRNDNDTTTTPLSWPHLTSLRLTSCNQINNTMWIDFINARPQLQQLVLNDIHQFNNSAFNAMATRLPKLKSLTLLGGNRITAEDIRQFIRNSLTLKRLELDAWPNVTCDDFPAFDFDLPTDDEYDREQYDSDGYENDNDGSDKEVPPIVFHQEYIDLVRRGEA